MLAVNKSVTSLVEAVTQNQMLLKNKLAQVLEFCPPPPPPPPVCKPEPVPCRPCPCVPPCFPQCSSSRPTSYQVLSCEKSAVQLTGQRERMLWSPDCCLPWRLCGRSGKNICWDACNPAQIRLAPGKTYAVQYTLSVCTPPPAEGEILLRQSPRGAFTDPLPLRFSAGTPQRTLRCVAVLHPRMGCDYGVTLSLMLNARAPLYLERAVIDVVEL